MLDPLKDPRRGRGLFSRFANASSTSTSTRVPAARSPGVAFSVSLWLMPRSQGTKIMPAGQSLAMCIAS